MVDGRPVIGRDTSLLADVLVDGAISAGLYRRLRRGDPSHWWTGAVRRTALPTVVLVVFFVVAGFAIQHVWPQAQTLRDAWRLVGSRAR